MSEYDRSHGTGDYTGTVELSIPRLFDALADRQRQEALAVVLERRGTVSEDELVEAVADRQGVDDEQVAVLFHHVHLPKLEEADLIRRDDGTVSLTESARAYRRDIEPLVEADASRENEAFMSVLSSERRQAILSLLADAGGSCPMPELATRLAATENETVSDEERARLWADVRHVQLPKLETAGLVSFEGGEIEYTGDASLEKLSRAVTPDRADANTFRSLP